MSKVSMKSEAYFFQIIGERDRMSNQMQPVEQQLNYYISDKGLILNNHCDLIRQRNNFTSLPGAAVKVFDDQIQYSLPKLIPSLVD